VRQPVRDGCWDVWPRPSVGRSYLSQAEAVKLYSRRSKWDQQHIGKTAIADQRPRTGRGERFLRPTCAPGGTCSHTRAAVWHRLQWQPWALLGAQGPARTQVRRETHPEDPGATRGQVQHRATTLRAQCRSRVHRVHTAGARDRVAAMPQVRVEAGLGILDRATYRVRVARQRCLWAARLRVRSQPALQVWSRA
jgi:hypothetical protein